MSSVTPSVTTTAPAISPTRNLTLPATATATESVILHMSSPTPSTTTTEFVTSSVNQSASVPSTALLPTGSESPSVEPTSSILENTTPVTTSVAVPSPTPPPESLCPPPPVSYTESDLVDIILALTSEEQMKLTVAGSQERCSLQDALAAEFVIGLRLLEADGGNRKKRQTELNEGYETVITEVGALDGVQSTTTFFIVNTTSPGLDILSAALVSQAFVSAAPQEVDSYPVISLPTVRSTASTPSTEEAEDLLVPVVSSVGGFLLLLILGLFLCLCFGLVWYKKKTDKVDILRHTEDGEVGMFRRTDDCEFEGSSHSIGIQHGTPVTSGGASGRGKRKASAITVGQLASTRADTWDVTSTSTRPFSQETRPPSSQPEHVPAALFERVAHYDTPQPSPSVRAMRMRFRATVAPSPSSSHRTHPSPTPHTLQGSGSSEKLVKQSSTEDTPVKAKKVLRPVEPPIRGMEEVSHEREAKKLREDALRLQEQREEEELRHRKKATLERLMLQSRQRDGDVRLRTTSRWRKRGKVGVMPEGMRPSTYGGARLTETRARRDERRGGRETEAVLGDEEATTPAGTPVEELPAGQGGRPSTRRKTWLRRKANRVGPLKAHTTDDYDSTDHHRRRVPTSRQSQRRIKLGRSQRARPLTRLATTGRMSRGVAMDAQRELAWMDTGMGVQLMRVQPVQPVLPPPPPQFTLPPHPLRPHVVTIQPHPSPIRPAWDPLPTLALHSQSYNQRQLQNLMQLHQQMEEMEINLDHSQPHTFTPAQPSPAHFYTPAHPSPAPPSHPHTLTPEQLHPSPKSSPEGGEEEEGEREAGTRGKESKADEGGERPPSQSQLESTGGPNLDSSTDLAPHLLATSKGGGGGRGKARVTSAPISPRQQEQVVLQPAYSNAAPAVAWHPMATPQQRHMATPQPVYAATPQPMYAAPPTHYHTLTHPPQYTYIHPVSRVPEERGQLVWAPDPTSLPQPTLTSAQLSHLRSDPALGLQDYPPVNTPVYEQWMMDPFHTAHPHLGLPSHTHVRTRARQDHFI